MSDLAFHIDERVGEVRTEALDISFGEIVNLHSNDELIIQPEYQRLFRWSLEQRSRLIESILLELPVPQIFVIENENGVLELIDGLQRVNSVIHFLDPEKLKLEPLVLTGCDLIEELNGKSFNDLPLVLRLRIKRTSVRMVIIKRQSKSFLRYEMFKRLNTGGEILAPQEIRNCSARMVGDNGTNFYSFLQSCADFGPFKICIEPISDADLQKKGDEELVLRFFALKNGSDLFRGSVRDWLDNYMETILLGESDFDYVQERSTFNDLFEYVSDVFGPGAFVKYRDGDPIGALAPAYFEAISIGVHNNLSQLRTLDKERVRNTVINLVQSEEFREVTGPGANAKWKLEKRMSLVGEAFENGQYANC